MASRFVVANSFLDQHSQLGKHVGVLFDDEIVNGRFLIGVASDGFFSRLADIPLLAHVADEAVVTGKFADGNVVVEADVLTQVHRTFAVAAAVGLVLQDADLDAGRGEVLLVALDTSSGFKQEGIFLFAACTNRFVGHRLDHHAGRETAGLAAREDVRQVGERWVLDGVLGILRRLDAGTRLVDHQEHAIVAGRWRQHVLEETFHRTGMFTRRGLVGLLDIHDDLAFYFLTHTDDGIENEQANAAFHEFEGALFRVLNAVGHDEFATVITDADLVEVVPVASTLKVEDDGRLTSELLVSTDDAVGQGGLAAVLVSVNLDYTATTGHTVQAAHVVERDKPIRNPLFRHAGVNDPIILLVARTGFGEQSTSLFRAQRPYRLKIYALYFHF